jgi:aspartyl-tRNA(Asn)/glutamyl-tRNA(Gln) amidotransferase subunit A
MNPEFLKELAETITEHLALDSIVVTDLRSAMRDVRAQLNLKGEPNAETGYLTDVELSEYGAVIDDFGMMTTDTETSDLLVKDCIAVDGTTMTAGSRSFRHESETDAAVVGTIRAAPDLKLSGTANMDAFAYGVTGTESELGAVQNPHSLDRIPGGSSSGCAAAVAAGTVDGAITTDTGGSTRIPAACCGIAGYKPTSDILPTDGVLPLAQSFDTLGIQAPTSDAIKHILDRTGYVLPDPETSPTSPFEIGVQEANQQSVAEVLRCAPAATDWTTRTIDLVPDHTTLERLLTAYATIVAVELLQLLAGRFETIPRTTIRDSVVDSLAEARAKGYRSQVLQDVYLVTTGVNAATDGRAYTAANELLREFQQHFEKIAESVDVICLPTIGCTVPQRPVSPTTVAQLLRYTFVANVVDAPALATPVGSAHPVPESVQLLASPGQDELLFRVAEQL